MSGISQIALVKVIDCDRLLEWQMGDMGLKGLWVVGCHLSYNMFSDSSIHALLGNNMAGRTE